jgi:hypothetical protein
MGVSNVACEGGKRGDAAVKREEDSAEPPPGNPQPLVRCLPPPGVATVPKLAGPAHPTGVDVAPRPPKKTAPARREPMSRSVLPGGRRRRPGPACWPRCSTTAAPPPIGHRKTQRAVRIRGNDGPMTTADACNTHRSRQQCRWGLPELLVQIGATPARMPARPAPAALHAPSQFSHLGSLKSFNKQRDNECRLAEFRSSRLLLYSTHRNFADPSKTANLQKQEKLKTLQITHRKQRVKGLDHENAFGHIPH